MIVKYEYMICDY